MQSKTLSKKSQTAPKASKIVRTAEWRDFTPGAAVKVSASILDGKNGYSWAFVCHAMNTETQSEWIEVFGGNKSHEGYRAFKPEQVSLVKIVPKVKKCFVCGREGSKRFKEENSGFRCSNESACANRT